MSEPTSQLTMLSLCNKVAKEAGIAYYGPAGTSPAMLPIDKDTLSRVKDCVNDGINMFVADAPENGWKWRKRIMQIAISNTRVTGTADSADATTLVDDAISTVYDTNDELNGWYIYISSGTGEGSFAQITDYVASSGTITVSDWLDENGNPGGIDPAASSGYIITPYETVKGDASRYYLPEDFGGDIIGNITYTKDTSHDEKVDWVSESEIRALSQNGDDSGYPYKAAIRPIEPVSGLNPKRRYELLLYPTPAQDDILEFPYAVVFNKLDIESGLVTSVNAGIYTLYDNTRSETDNYFNGYKLSIIDGPGKGESAIISDYASSTGSFIFTAGTWFTIAPTTSSVYIVEPVNNLHPAGIKFDHVVKSACLAQMELDFSNTAMGRIEAYIQKDLQKAYQADARSFSHITPSKKVRRLRTWNPVEFLGEL